MPFKYASLRDRLNANSHPVPNPAFKMPCRIWDGMKGGSLGYGKLTVRSRYRHKYGKRKGERRVRRLYAHRVSKAESMGISYWSINHCCHMCHVPACIEPTHIYTSSRLKRNNRDTVRAGRHANGHGRTGQ